MSRENKHDVNIHVVPDRERTLAQVRSRFEMPSWITDSPLFPEFLEKAAKQVVKKTAQKNALRGWHYRGDLPVTIDKSEVQFSLHEFGTTNPENYEAQSAGDDSILLTKYDKIAYVAVMWFEVPKVRTEVLSNEELDEDDGFVRDKPLPDQGLDNIVKV